MRGSEGAAKEAKLENKTIKKELADVRREHSRLAGTHRALLREHEHTKKELIDVQSEHTQTKRAHEQTKRELAAGLRRCALPLIRAKDGEGGSVQEAARWLVAHCCPEW